MKVVNHEGEKSMIFRKECRFFKLKQCSIILVSLRASLQRLDEELFSVDRNGAQLFTIPVLSVS